MVVLWFLLCIAFVVVFVGAVVSLTIPEARAKAAGIAVLSTVLFVTASFFFTWTSVEAGYVGLVKQFGAYQEEVKDAGAVFHYPWQSIEQARVRNASHEVLMNNPKGGPDGGAASAESQEVFVVATFNYSLEKACVRDLYTNYGASYYETIVEPRIKQIFKAETVKFEAIKILPNRELIRRETQAELQRQLQQYCIRSLDFLLKNVGFGADFTAAIERKQVATQDAVTEQNKVQISIQQANQAIETARGEAQSTRIKAAADAYANRLRGQNLTRNLVEWERIQRWPKPSQVYLPSDAIIVAGNAQVGGGR